MQLAKVGFLLHLLLFSLCLATQLRSETESRMDALHDSLTGLPGLTLLHEQFEQAVSLSQRKNWNIALFFLDLDGFKAVNDNYGHAAGDQLLVEVSSRMRAQLRQVDSVARIGGDEFIILLTEVNDVRSATTVAEKLRDAISEPVWVDGKKATVSASIGVALFPNNGSDLSTLREAADQAMYAAKRKGKNTCVVASSNRVVPFASPGALKAVRA